jgi:hypothetical protein
MKIIEKSNEIEPKYFQMRVSSLHKIENTCFAQAGVEIVDVRKFTLVPWLLRGLQEIAFLLAFLAYFSHFVI